MQNKMHGCTNNNDQSIIQNYTSEQGKVCVSLPRCHISWNGQPVWYNAMERRKVIGKQGWSTGTLDGLKGEKKNCPSWILEGKIGRSGLRELKIKVLGAYKHRDYRSKQASKLAMENSELESSGKSQLLGFIIYKWISSRLMRFHQLIDEKQLSCKID